jgi:hypothetical protein
MTMVLTQERPGIRRARTPAHRHADGAREVSAAVFRKMRTTANIAVRLD